MGPVFTPAFAGVAGIAVAVLGLQQDHPRWPVLFVAALGFFGLIFWGLTRGRVIRLPDRATALVAAGLIGFAVCAPAEQLQVSQSWPYLWCPAAFAGMGAFLAIRARSATAWLVFFVGLIPILGFSWATPAGDYLTNYAVSGMFVLLILGTVFPVAFRWVLGSLSIALRTDTTEATELAVVASRRGYLRDSVLWLRRQLERVLNPVDSADTRRAGAVLLELRLRDAIRSPGVDIPETSRAVWAARNAGVTVFLRGSLTSALGSAGRVTRQRTNPAGRAQQLRHDRGG